MRGADRKRYDYQLWSFVRELGRLLPHEMADEVEQGWPDEGGYLTDTLNQMIETLRFRHEMHQEFAR